MQMLLSSVCLPKQCKIIEKKKFSLRKKYMLPVFEEGPVSLGA